MLFDVFCDSYYNSMYDTSNDTLNASDPDAYSNVTPDVNHVQKIATTIARTVFTILLGNTSDVETVEANNITVSHFIWISSPEIAGMSWIGTSLASQPIRRRGRYPSF